MDKIEQRAVLNKVIRNVVTLQDELSLNEMKTDPRTDIPDLLNTDPTFKELLEIYYKADRLIETAQKGMGLIFEALDGSIAKLDKEILQEQNEKKYDLVYLSSNYMRRALHVRVRDEVRALCGTMPQGNVNSYMSNVTLSQTHPASCIRCSKIIEKLETA